MLDIHSTTIVEIKTTLKTMQNDIAELAALIAEQEKNIERITKKYE